MNKASLAFIVEGKSALNNKDYKNAILKLNKALAISSSNSEAQDLKEKAMSELRSEMKNLYGESVIEENLGNIESAKKKWKTILDQDVPADDYYQKAKSKLSKYEK
jgi:tetratricopeptide (TPR) repeat protein